MPGFRAPQLQSMVYALLLTACGGGGSDDSPPPPPPPPGVRAEFGSIQDRVFTPICVECHVGAFATGNLRLEESVSYDMLVNQPSVEVPSLLRVAPGDAQNSYIIQKLEGRAAVGGRMPLGLPPLSNQTIAAIRQWIDEGAQPAVAARVARAPARLRSSFPANEGRLAHRVAPLRLRLAFDRELDATRVLPGSVELRRVDDGSRIAASALLDDAAPTTLLIAPQAPLAPGRYRLRLSGEAPSPLTDLEGRAIDGDGDGLAGGDAVLEFRVDAAP